MAWTEPKTLKPSCATGGEAWLFEGFAVCGLALPLVSIPGGDVGSHLCEFHRFSPSLVDQLFINGRKAPQQLPTCCMPGGVEVISATRAGSRLELAAFQAPAVYSLVLTDGGGRRLYVTCLSYTEPLNPAITSRHEHLRGAHATRALCLISRLPYLATAEQVLRRLYTTVFRLGPSAPVGDLLRALLRLPSPATMHREVRFHFERQCFRVLPPDETGVPGGGETSLRALLIALSPVNVILSFLAVLLERRVVLVSRHLRLPTLAAEALLQLLWPFRYKHVYVPLVPASLLDLLEAPTPFLMGLGGWVGTSFAAEVAIGAGADGRGGGGWAGGGGGSGGCDGLAGAAAAARTHNEGLVVVDLDKDWVYECGELLPYLEHPAIAQLRCCLTALRKASDDMDCGGGGGGGGFSDWDGGYRSNRGRSGRSGGWNDLAFCDGTATATVTALAVGPAVDPWMPYIRVAAKRGWAPSHDALVRRLFLRLFSCLLRGYHEFLPAAVSAAAQGAERSSGGGGGGGSSNSSSTRGCSVSDPGSSSNGGGGAGGVGRTTRFSPSSSSMSWAFQVEGFLFRHCQTHGQRARPLPAQLVQTQGFYLLIDEYGGRDPYGWYRTACTACREGLEELAAAVSAEQDYPDTKRQQQQRQQRRKQRLRRAPGKGESQDDGLRDGWKENDDDGASDGGGGGGGFETAGAADGRNDGCSTGAWKAAAAAAAEPQVIIIIGAPAEDEDDGGAGSAANESAARHVQSYCKPCPLLQRRKAPVYRIFPSLHVSDLQYSSINFAADAVAVTSTSTPTAATAVTAAAAAGVASWQWNALDQPPSSDTAANRTPRDDAIATGAGAATTAGGGGEVGSASADISVSSSGAAGGLSSWKLPLTVNRRNRSLSGSLSGDMAPSLVGVGVGEAISGKPRYRISSCEVSTSAAAATTTTACTAAVSTPTATTTTTTGGGGSGRGGGMHPSQMPASSPAISEMPSARKSAAAAVVAEASSISVSFTNRWTSLSHTLRVGRKGTPPVTTLAAASLPAAAVPRASSLTTATGGAASTTSAPPASQGQGMGPNGNGPYHKGSNDHNRHNEYEVMSVAEQELVRLQIAALTQLLSWGEVVPPLLPSTPTPQQQQQNEVSCGKTAVAAAGTAAAVAATSSGASTLAAAELSSRFGGVPGEAEVERLRTLLCLQVGSNGGILIDYLQKEAATSEARRQAVAAAANDGAITGANAVTSSIPMPSNGRIGAAFASGGGGSGGRSLHPVAFSVLADAFDAIVNAAVQQQVFAVLTATLELSMKLYTSAGSGSAVRLLHALSSNPYLYTCYIWGGLLSHQLRSAAAGEAATTATASTPSRGSGGVRVAALSPSPLSPSPPPPQPPLAAAAAAAAGAGAVPVGAQRTPEGPAGGGGVGGGCRPTTAVVPAEALTVRQRGNLQVLHRSLCTQATWLMHLGVVEEAAWLLLMRLVAALSAAKSEWLHGVRPGHLPQQLLNVRSALRHARCEASLQQQPLRLHMLVKALGHCCIGPGRLWMGFGMGAGWGQPSSPPHCWPLKAGRRTQPLGVYWASPSTPPKRGNYHSRLKPSGQPMLRQQQQQEHKEQAQDEQQQQKQQTCQLRVLSPPLPPPQQQQQASLAGRGRSLRLSLDIPFNSGRADCRAEGEYTDPRVARLISTPTATTARHAGGSAGNASVRAASGQSPESFPATPTAFRASFTSAAGINAVGGGAVIEPVIKRERRAANTNTGGPLSPTSSTANKGSFRYASAGAASSGGSAGNGYSVKYERHLAAAAVAAAAAAAAALPCRARLASPGSLWTGSQYHQQQQQQPQQAGSRPNPASRCSVALGSGRPIVALAAAGGLVLAAPQEPACFVLSCQQDGSLRVTAKLPLSHLDAAYADKLAISPDGGTAALSVAPLTMPPRTPLPTPPRLQPQPVQQHRPSPACSEPRQVGAGALPAAATAAAAAAAAPDTIRSRVLAVVDVRAGRIVRELQPASHSRINALVLSPTANLLASGCAASWARLWDARLSRGGGGGGGDGGGGGGGGRCAPVVSLATRQGGVSALLLDSCRLRLYTGGRDGTAAEWDLRKPTCPVVVYGGHNGWVTSLELLTPSTTLTENRHVERCWGTVGEISTTTAAAAAVATASTAAATGTCASPHGHDDINLLRALDPLTYPVENWRTPRRVAQRPMGSCIDLYDVVLSWPSPYLVTGSTDWTVRIWSPPAAVVAADGAAGAAGVNCSSAPAAVADTAERSAVPTPGVAARPRHGRTRSRLGDGDAGWRGDDFSNVDDTDTGVGVGVGVGGAGNGNGNGEGGAWWSTEEGNRRNRGSSRLSPPSLSSPFTGWAPGAGGAGSCRGGGSDGGCGADHGDGGGGDNDIEVLDSSDDVCGQSGGHNSDTRMDGGGGPGGGSAGGGGDGGGRSGVKPPQPASSPSWRMASPSPSSTSTSTSTSTSPAPSTPTSTSSSWQQQRQQDVRYCRKPRSVLMGHGGAITALYVDKSAGVGAGRCGDAAASTATTPATIYTGAKDGSVGAWTADGHCEQLFPAHRGAVTLLATVPSPASSSLTSNNFAVPTSPHPHPHGKSSHHNNNNNHFHIDEMSTDVKLRRPAGTQPAGGCAPKPDQAVPLERLLVTSGAEGSAGLWALTHGSLGYSPLLDRNETGSLARVAAWDAARGVLLQGDECGVVRAWVPGERRA